jgi:NADH:ubiquinone oxidoreductase subunit F (NADH-binding)
MRKSVLIKDTTEEERRQIVAKGLDWCGDSSCDLCSGCTMGIGSLEAMYQPYIDGKLELREINMLHAATKYTHG